MNISSLKHTPNLSPTPLNKDFCTISHQIWPPKLAIFQKNTNFSWKSMYSDPWKWNVPYMFNCKKKDPFPQHFRSGTSTSVYLSAQRAAFPLVHQEHDRIKCSSQQQMLHLFCCKLVKWAGLKLDSYSTHLAFNNALWYVHFHFWGHECLADRSITKC